MISFVLSCIVCLTGVVPGDRADITFPFGVTPGQTTVQDVERLLGVGAVAKGGHSNSARIWKLPGFSVRVDGFDLDRQRKHHILDTIAVSSWKGEIKPIKLQSGRIADFGLLNGLRAGWSEEDLAGHYSDLVRVNKGVNSDEVLFEDRKQTIRIKCILDKGLLKEVVLIFQ